MDGKGILNLLNKASRFSKIAEKAQAEKAAALADDGKIDAQEWLGIIGGVLDDVLTGGLLHNTSDSEDPQDKQV